MSEADFLTHCVAAQTQNPMLERVRGKSAEVTLAVYRLVKTALVHAADNSAVHEAAALCAKVLDSFSAETGATVSVTFVEDSIFVCGQLMKASRSAYEAGAELGEILRVVGVSELSFDRWVTVQQLVELVRLLVSATRDPNARGALLDGKLAGVVARKVDPRLLRRRADEHLTPAQRALELYSTSLVVMRQFYEDVAAGVTVLPHHVKRLAQRFVAFADDEDPSMLGMMTLAKSHRDDAGRAVQTAILSLAIAQQITKQRVVLAQIVLSALMADAGGARARSRAGERYLSEAEEAHVLGAAAFACITTGGVNPQSAFRTVIVLETAWAERRAQIGEPWMGNVRPLLASEIIALARDTLERIAPRQGAPAATPLQALEAVISRPRSNRVLSQALVRAVGIVPIGTVVELSSGAVAVVMGPSRSAANACTVRVLVEPGGKPPAASITLDLGASPGVSIAKIADPRRLSVDASRPFVE